MIKWSHALSFPLLYPSLLHLPKQCILCLETAGAHFNSKPTHQVTAGLQITIGTTEPSGSHQLRPSILLPQQGP